MSIGDIARSYMPHSLLAPLRRLLHGYYSARVWFYRTLHRKNVLHIAICGYPRSGTSLLQNMLTSTTRGFAWDSFETRAAERVHRPGNYITKTPMDIFDIDEILEKNIHGKEILVIVVTRDIRDVLTSVHPLLPDRYFINYENSWWPQNATFTRWDPDAPGIRDIHAQVQKVMTMSRKYLHTENIRYESLVSDPDFFQKQLTDKYGIHFVGRFSEFHKNSKRHAYKYEGKYQARNNELVNENKPVQQNRIAKWKMTEHRQVVKQEFSKHPELFDILIEDGYEQNRDWYTHSGDFRD